MKIEVNMLCHLRFQIYKMLEKENVSQCGESARLVQAIKLRAANMVCSVRYHLKALI